MFPGLINVYRLYQTPSALYWTVCLAKHVQTSMFYPACATQHVLPSMFYPACSTQHVLPSIFNPACKTSIFNPACWTEHVKILPKLSPLLKARTVNVIATARAVLLYSMPTPRHLKFLRNYPKVIKFVSNINSWTSPIRKFEKKIRKLEIKYFWSFSSINTFVSSRSRHFRPNDIWSNDTF